MVGTATLLQPAAVMAYVLAFWRLGSDLNITGQFAISKGIFSHWQVWLALAVATHLAAIILNRRLRRNGYISDDSAAL